MAQDSTGGAGGTSPVPPPGKLAKAALGYAAKLGWAVLPVAPVRVVESAYRCACRKGADCPSPGKHPLPRHGVREATADAASIRQWWTTWPSANVAVAMGAVSGVWCLDVDGEEGEDALRALARRHGHAGPIEASVEALTSRGRHLVFKHPGASVIVPNKVALAAKLDVRGDGGYIVVSPSLHISGRRYEWEASSHPLDHAPEPAPDWLVTLVLAQGRADEAARPPAQAGMVVVEGGRNDALFRLGCWMRGKGFSERAIRSALRDENAGRCRPPLDESEVDTIATSAAGYTLGSDEGAPGGAVPADEPTTPVDDVAKQGGQAVTDFAVLEVVRQNSEPPMYRLKIRPFVNGTTRSADDSILWLHLDQEQYCEKRKFLRAFHARFAREPKVPAKSEGWRALRNAWDRAAKVERVPAEVSARESLLREIRQVIDDMTIGETADDVRRGNVVEWAGEYYVSLPAVQERLDRRTRTVSMQALAARFRDLGMQPGGGTRSGTASVKGRAVSAWVLPPDMRPKVADETVDG